MRQPALENSAGRLSSGQCPTWTGVSTSRELSLSLLVSLQRRLTSAHGDVHILLAVRGDTLDLELLCHVCLDEILPQHSRVCSLEASSESRELRTEISKVVMLVV